MQSYPPSHCPPAPNGAGDQDLGGRGHAQHSARFSGQAPRPTEVGSVRSLGTRGVLRTTFCGDTRVKCIWGIYDMKDWVATPLEAHRAALPIPHPDVGEGWGEGRSSCKS